MYYIEFLPAGQPRPKIVFDFPSTPEHYTLLEKLKDLRVTEFGVKYRKPDWKSVGWGWIVGG